MVRVRYSFGSRHTGKLENIDKQKVSFPQVMRDVIAISDIVLQVIDARFIMDTRNPAIEDEIRSLGKKVVYVFNKSDLIDRASVSPAVLKLRPHVFVSTRDRKGIGELRDRIKIEAKRVDIGDKTRVHVGIIGYPNAGKSSLINCLARRGVASTSKHAGHTKGMQKIRLVEDILLLDTPGVIPESDYASDDKSRRAVDTKLGARTYSHVRDPEVAVHHLMQDYAPSIEAFYEVDAGGDSEVLIDVLGKKRNFLAKGGSVDIDRTSRLILRDWQEGKIKG